MDAFESGDPHDAVDVMMEKSTMKINNNLWTSETLVLPLIEQLSAIRHRRFMIGLQEELAKWFFFGTVAAVILSLAGVWVWMPVDVVYFATLPLFLGICIGLVKAVRNRENLLNLAQLVDRKFHLKERVSTAFETESANRRLTQLEQLQVADAKKAISSIDLYGEFSYKIPKFAKFIPPGLVLIAVIFWLAGQSSLQYKFERKAMLQTANELEKLAKPSDPQLHELIKDLRNDRPNVEAIQTELAKVHASFHNRGNNLQSNLTEDLERLVERDDLPPKFRSKLRALIDKGKISELQSNIDAELKKEIEKVLGQVNELARLDEVSKAIQIGQQRIGLAGLKVADSTGNPGSESGTDEAVGTEVRAKNRKVGKHSLKNEKMEMPDNPQSETSETLVLQNPKSREIEINNQNRLTLEGMESDSENFSPVFAPDFSAETGESFSQYRKVYLSAQQELVEAISNEQIPVRYEQQVKDYFEGIHSPAAKEEFASSDAVDALSE